MLVFSSQCSTRYKEADTKTYKTVMYEYFHVFEVSKLFKMRDSSTQSRKVHAMLQIHSNNASIHYIRFQLNSNKINSSTKVKYPDNQFCPRSVAFDTISLLFWQTSVFTVNRKMFITTSQYLDIHISSRVTLNQNL